MTRKGARKAGRVTVVRALEEARYGPQGLLNLRDSMPSEVEATTRAESWLRERQMLGVAETLIITGRGQGSPGGIGVVREGVRKLLNSLRRRGVIEGFSENGPGSFLVRVAPIRSLFEAPARRGERKVARAGTAAVPDGTGLAGLGPELSRDLRRLAEQSLISLGVARHKKFVDGEMLRQFTLLATSLPVGAQREQLLADAIQRALSEYEGG
jgi:hypothetical protein